MKLVAFIQLTQAEVAVYASRYNYKLEDKILSSVDQVREQGFLSKLQFQQICEWKSQRIRSRVQANSEESIINTTKLALGTQDIRLSVHLLQALHGVGMPVASSILHWYHPEPFPILDFRALWTLGLQVPKSYTLDFWEDYVQLIRSISKSWQVDLRTLDKALWQYSTEHQPPNNN